MYPEEPAKRRRVLLVASTPCERQKQSLKDTGREIVKTNSGEDAIFEAKRARFDLAVLVSTGNSMDMAETVFNLRDARPSMPIVIMTMEVSSEEAEMIADACPRVYALTSEGLAALVAAHYSEH
jgi:DNA-binding NarL/FixJ family response regulator